VHDGIWKALADPHRRTILDLLNVGSKSTGEICELLSHLDRCTVMKHLEVLVRANLVLVERRGRTRLNFLNPLPLHEIVERWVSGHTARLAQGAFRLKSVVEGVDNGKNDS